MICPGALLNSQETVLGRRCGICILQKRSARAVVSERELSECHHRLCLPFLNCAPRCLWFSNHQWSLRRIMSSGPGKGVRCSVYLQYPFSNIMPLTVCRTTAMLHSRWECDSVLLLPHPNAHLRTILVRTKALSPKPHYT